MKMDLKNPPFPPFLVGGRIHKTKSGKDLMVCLEC
jgi:hypothetical protein